jgi:site-specific recombinase XerC
LKLSSSVTDSELLPVPDRSKIKGKRDYAILALLLGCALRRQELSNLDVDGIEMREGRWVLPDLCGKGSRVFNAIWRGVGRLHRGPDGRQKDLSDMPVI